jgi:hypothetical protein
MMAWLARTMVAGARQVMPTLGRGALESGGTMKPLRRAGRGCSEVKYVLIM